MRITRIAFGRTYNTGNFTSYRFDVEMLVEEFEDPWTVLSDGKHDLQLHAHEMMAKDGVRHVTEPAGIVLLPQPPKPDPEEDAVDIPF
jgi:hypothetical protein